MGGGRLGGPVVGRVQVHATADDGRSLRLVPDGRRGVEGEAAFAASGTCIARAGAVLAVATGGSRSVLHFLRDGAVQWQRVASGFDAGAESKGVFSLAAADPAGFIAEIGRAHVCTPVTNAHLVCRLLLEKKKTLYT